MGVAATNEFRAVIDKEEKRSKMCPCCGVCVETTEHITRCDEAGRVEFLLKLAEALDGRMEDMDTDEVLRDCIMEYIEGRGAKTMSSICRRLGPRFKRMGTSQDKIGWSRFMEGMVSKEIVALQRQAATVHGLGVSVHTWATGLVMRLLEIVHGQWLYRNLVVHDEVSGSLVNKKKEELREKIEEVQAMGGEGLSEEERFLSEINLEDLENSSGEKQTYWLLAMQTYKKRRLLKEQRARAEQEED